MRDWFRHLDLRTRLLVTVVGMAVAVSLTLLLALGLPLRAVAVHTLQLNAEREASGLGATLARNADHVSVERLFDERIRQPQLARLSFSTAGWRVERRIPDGSHAWPHWFASLVALPMPTASVTPYPGARLVVELDRGLALDQLWRLLWQYLALFTLGLAAYWYAVLRLLRNNLSGLDMLQRAAWAVEAGDLGARAVEPAHAPPELIEAARAFNRMAEHVQRSVDALASEQQTTSTDRERMRVTIASIGDGVIVTDANGVVESINPRACEIVGLVPDEAIGRRAAEVLPLQDELSGVRLGSPVDLALRRGRALQLDQKAVLQRPDGRRVAIRDSAAPIRSADGVLLGCVLVFQDETERRDLVRRLAWQADHDPLTGLYNRRVMEERLAAALYDARASDAPYSFAFVDLDRFKLVNDTCGHHAGDELLKRVATSMSQSLGTTPHLLARLGGNEFGVLFERFPFGDALAEMQRLRDDIARLRFEWEGQRFRLGASSGLVSFDTPPANVAEVLSHADAACRHAKTLGDAIQVYDPTHPALQRIGDEMQWVGVITQAFEAHRFMLFRQEKRALFASGKPRQYEVLLRLHDEHDLPVSPADFLPAAERYGLAPSFDRWVIRNLFAYLDTHPKDDAHYAINLSGRSLGDPGTLPFITEALAQHDIDPTRLSFEITETAAIDNLDECERLILALNARGIHFALDDFGKGHSSFGYLKRLPVDTLKIDGDFVRGITQDREKLAIVKAMHTLAHELGKSTVAEQVETESEFTCLRQIGVDYAQGYYVHPPEALRLD